MKIFTSLLAALIIGNVSFAQYKEVQNNIFMFWDHTPEKTVGGTTYPAYDEPAPDHFWTTANPSTRTIKYNPTVMKTTDSYEGDYACLMRSTKFPFGVAAGSLMTGEYRGGLDPGKAVFLGKPWEGRPERFVGFYKYKPIDNDKCLSYVWLFKSVSGVRDTVGFVSFTPDMQKNTVTTYTKFDLPIKYYNTNDPDSIVMIFTASFDGSNFNGGDGSELYIDRILLLYPGETSVNNTTKQSAHFWVYPNPTSEFINFVIDPSFLNGSELFIYNSQGQIVKRETINKEFNEYDIREFPSGSYSYRVMQVGALITEGKFIKN